MSLFGSRYYQDIIIRRGPTMMTIKSKLFHTHKKENEAKPVNKVLHQLSF